MLDTGLLVLSVQMHDCLWHYCRNIYGETAKSSYDTFANSSLSKDILLFLFYFSVY